MWLLYDLTIGLLIELVVEWAGPRVARLVTTRVLILGWVAAFALSGWGIYILLTYADVVWAGVGAALLIAGIPSALILTAMWRDQDPSRLRKRVQ